MTRSILCLFLAFFCALPALNAQKPRSTLILRMEDGQPLTVAVNNRYFHKTGTRLIIGDVPGKRPYLQVYRFRPYADGEGGKAELVFSGQIKIERGGRYEVIVRPGHRSVRVARLSATGDAAFTDPGNARADYAASGPVYEAGRPPWLHALLEKMSAEIKDSEKLQLALSGLPDKLSTAEALLICEAILFEDNKRGFLKTASPRISDRSNIDRLRQCLHEGTADGPEGRLENGD